MVNRVTLGPVHTVAALLKGDTDIALGGPDLAVLSAINAKGESLKVIAAISEFEGSFLVVRKRIKPSQFRWDLLKDKALMGWRVGTLPSVFLETALRNSNIDPHADLDYRPNVPFPKRIKAWRGREVDYAVFYLRHAVKLEREGAGYPVASVGAQAGSSVYAVFLATAEYIRGHPQVIQKFANAIQAALHWTASAPVADLVNTSAVYLKRDAPEDLAESYRRYRPIGMWQTDPTVGRDAMDKVQTMMIKSDVMAPTDRVPYETVVEPRVAENAKRAAQK